MANVYKLNPRTGDYGLQVGIHTIEGIDFDNKGNLYVLESMTNPGYPDAFRGGVGHDRTGKSLGRSGDGADWAELSFGDDLWADGKLYVSNLGFAALFRGRTKFSKWTCTRNSPKERRGARQWRAAHVFRRRKGWPPDAS